MKKQNKKLMALAISSMICALLVSGIISVGFAEDTAPKRTITSPVSVFEKIIKGSGLQNFAGRFHKLSSVEPGADIITSIIFIAIDLIKYVLGTLAVIFITISGVKLITAGKKIDEVSEKEKETIQLMLYGLIMVIIADELVFKAFFGDYGECVASASNAKDCAKEGSSIIKGVYDFLFSIMATVSLVVLTISGFRMITAYGEEDEINKNKKHIAMAIVGLLIAGVAEYVVKAVIFPEAGSEKIDVKKTQELVLSFTGYIASFIATGAFIMAFYAGYLYVTAFGNEDQTGKAKKIIVAALIGIVIAAAAYGLVVTITSFTPGSVEVNLPERIPGT